MKVSRLSPLSFLVDSFKGGAIRASRVDGEQNARPDSPPLVASLRCQFECGSRRLMCPGVGLAYPGCAPDIVRVSLYGRSFVAIRSSSRRRDCQSRCRNRPEVALPLEASFNPCGGTWEAPMGVLMLRCSATGREFSTGVQADDESLKA